AQVVGLALIWVKPGGHVRFGSEADMCGAIGHVRFGSKADMCGAKAHVRFTPNSDHESGLPQEVMSALPPKADMCGATSDVRFGPKADIGIHGSRLWRYGGKYIVGRHGATDALQRKIANWFDGYGIFNRHQHTRTN